MAEFQLQLSEGLWLREQAVERVRSKYRVWVDRVGLSGVWDVIVSIGQAIWYGGGA